MNIKNLPTSENKRIHTLVRRFYPRDASKTLRMESNSYTGLSDQLKQVIPKKKLPCPEGTAKFLDKLRSHEHRGPRCGHPRAFLTGAVREVPTPDDYSEETTPRSKEVIHYVKNKHHVNLAGYHRDVFMGRPYNKEISNLSRFRFVWTWVIDPKQPGITSQQFLGLKGNNHGRPLEAGISLLA